MLRGRVTQIECAVDGDFVGFPVCKLLAELLLCLALACMARIWSSILLPQAARVSSKAATRTPRIRLRRMPGSGLLFFRITVISFSLASDFPGKITGFSGATFLRSNCRIALFPVKMVNLRNKKDKIADLCYFIHPCCPASVILAILTVAGASILCYNESKFQDRK